MMSMLIFAIITFAMMSLVYGLTIQVFDNIFGGAGEIENIGEGSQVFDHVEQVCGTEGLTREGEVNFDSPREESVYLEPCGNGPNYLCLNEGDEELERWGPSGCSIDTSATCSELDAGEYNIVYEGSEEVLVEC